MKLKLQDSYVGIVIILAIIVMLVQLPTILLDILLMLNIFLGMLILLNALYSQEPLDMSLFPTILLVSTMMKLVLNIATTRSILMNGDAGAVIAAFGQRVAGGDLVIGLVVFAVIVIVNFMVITKGSERVAEVTARFTLDAMPGKQMAIDADLNTGLIDEEEAKARRKKISDESSFFGSMDGASKFVKGDAIAGILITFINIIGGVALGAARHGMSIGDALNKYALLTVGDGLVGMIPALLISVATGLLVTKATTEASISQTLSKQLFSNSLVMFIIGGSLIFIAIPLPLPKIIFWPFGLFLLYMGFKLQKKQEVEAIKTEISTDDTAIEQFRQPENIMATIEVDKICLLVGYGLVPMVEASQGGDLADRILMIRRQLALEMGAITPMIRARDHIKLAPSEYRIQIKGEDVAGGDVMFDHYLALNPGYVDEEIEGIETVEPSSGMPALWISEMQRERAEAMGYNVVDPPAIIATHLTETIRMFLHELLTRQDVLNLMNNVKESNPVLVDEVNKHLNIGDIQKVLANLLRERISIRDLVTILETLADYGPITRDTDMLTEQVRQALKRTISKRFFGAGSNMVLTLDPALEQKIIESVKQTEQGSYIALDPRTTQSILDRLKSEITKMTSIGLDPIILTSPIVRTYFKRLVEPIVPNLTVLSYNEIDTSVELQSVGLVTA